MERKFKQGDTVRLVSDGNNTPVMTVNIYAIDESLDARLLLDISDEQKKMIKCVWRDTNGTPHNEYYSEDALMKVN